MIAGNPKTEAPPASRERWRKRRRVTGGMFMVTGSKWPKNQILRPEFIMQLFYIGNIREAAGDRHFLSRPPNRSQGYSRQRCLQSRRRRKYFFDQRGSRSCALTKSAQIYLVKATSVVQPLEPIPCHPAQDGFLSFLARGRKSTLCLPKGHDVKLPSVNHARARESPTMLPAIRIVKTPRTRRVVYI